MRVWNFFVKIINLLKNSQHFQNFSIYGIGQLFNLLTPLLVAPYLIKICGEEGFGMIGIGLSFVFILTVLVDFASGINGVKEISIHRDDSKTVQKIAVTLFSIKLISLVFVIVFSTKLPYSISYKLNKLCVLYSNFILPSNVGFNISFSNAVYNYLTKLLCIIKLLLPKFDKPFPITKLLYPLFILSHP